MENPKDVKINAAFENPKKIIVIILNPNWPIKHFVVFGFIMHEYMYLCKKKLQNV